MGKHIIGVLAGAAVTVALLLLMRSVIGDPQAATDSGIEGRVVDFVEVQEDRDIVVERTEPPPLPPPIKPPRPLPPTFDDDETIGVPYIDDVPDIEDVPQISGAGFSDGDYLPIVRVQPVYPRRAQARGIEGYVLLEFAVTTAGAVRDPVVVEATPPGIFDRAAISAALKFKYKPKVVQGEPVEVSGVRTLIKFELQE